jgi:hypothetical protein
MSRNEKLNQILNGLLFLRKRKLNSEKLPEICEIHWLCKTLNLETETWEELLIEEQLVNDGFVDKTETNLSISKAGHNFIIDGGYIKKAKRIEQEDKIKEETIKKFRYDKFAFLFALIALVISLISLLIKL